VTEQACSTDADCADGETCNSGCFLPGEPRQQFDIHWSIEDFFNAAETDPRVSCDFVCGPDGSGFCRFTLEVAVPESGQAYVNVHLNYGLRGVHQDANPCDDYLVDRYDQGESSGTQFKEVGFDAWVNNDSQDGTDGIGIADCTDYRFSHDDGDKLFTSSVQNLNVFKPIAGVFGQGLNSKSGDGYAGLKLTLTRRSDPNSILQTATTDQDGFYALPYKHKGKPAMYNVNIYDATGTTRLSSIAVELQGNGWTNVNFDSSATLEEICDSDKSFCECNGWCATAEYGSGRQSNDRGNKK
jgi:hypothetical protein